MGAAFASWLINMLMRWLVIMMITNCFLFSACSTSTNYAPVTEVTLIDPIPKTGKHRVLPGETLYEIAWRYGLDYRLLAKHNQIDPSYLLRAGQIIYLTNNSPSTDLKTSIVNRPAAPSLDNIETQAIQGWQWPARGKVIHSFSASQKGINIAGSLGDPIYAAASGKVVYSGNGLRGYGNLIIIKHNSLYFSAYAHNKVLYVKEGDLVKQGQEIAEMGNTGADRTMLHFEIRQAGKPINPISLLRS